MPCGRVLPFMKKSNKSVRCISEQDYLIEARNKIQRRAETLLGGSDDAPYKASGGFADGNHRVPNVNANSDGDFNFNLGNFENAWNDNNALLCFCNSNDFSRYLLAGVL